MTSVMDLRAFKGLRYDLDEIGLALALNEPGQETLGRARKAVARLRCFLMEVPEPVLGVFSDCDLLDRYFGRKLKPAGLFAGAGQDAGLASARGVASHLRDYLEDLEKAWSLCALAPVQADLAVEGRSAGQQN